MIKVHLVNYEQGMGIDGILSKYANKMAEELEKLGVAVSVSAQPEPADINHHINYYSYVPSGTIDTLQITHIWEGDRLEKLKKGIKTATGICFSKETEEFLRSKGIETTTILPAHDGYPRKKKRVCILTNVYPNGCKREGMFYELLGNIDRSKFHFYIMGKNWNVDGLNMTLIEKFNPLDYAEILNKCDYCLYFGLDEGSMGVLDAKQVGMKIIAPLQGFHKEIGIDYPFDTQKELNKIFKDLEFNPVESWTWNNYCLQHKKLWEKLKER